MAWTRVDGGVGVRLRRPRHHLVAIQRHGHHTPKEAYQAAQSASQHDRTHSAMAYDEQIADATG
jgi:hypothetical protein